MGASGSGGASGGQTQTGRFTCNKHGIIGEIRSLRQGYQDRHGTAVAVVDIFGKLEIVTSLLDWPATCEVESDYIGDSYLMGDC